jgi:hypothetical protein
MQIDSAGRLGIGTTSPVQTLDVNGTAKIGAPTGSAYIEVGQGATESRFAYIDFVGDTTYTDYGLRLIRNDQGANTTSQLTHRGTGDLTIRTEEAADITFITNNTERARIDLGGRLLVGAPGSVGVNNITAGVQIHNTATNNGASLSIARFNDDTVGGQIILAKSRNTTLTAGAAVQANDELGILAFSGDDGTDLNSSAARIQCFIDGTPGANNMPGRLVFSTTASGASSPTERMRINSDGTTVFSGAVTLPSGSTVAGYQQNFDHIATTTSTGITGNQWVSVLNPGATITLPATPPDGMEVRISVGNFTNTVVARNGANIMNAAADLTIDVAYKTVTLIYDGLTVGPTPVFGWRII